MCPEIPCSGEIVTIVPTKQWTYANRLCFGKVFRSRLDVAALGLGPLALRPEGEWDRAEEYCSTAGSGTRARKRGRVWRQGVRLDHAPRIGKFTVAMAQKERFLAAILAGDFAGALATASEARERGLSFLYEDVVAWALVEVGRLWEAGRISVADEHVATAVAQSVLACFYPSFPWAPSGPKAIVACVDGEQHALGARMAADLLACDGWNVIFVGASVPNDALLAIVAREAPILVGISVTMTEHLPRLCEAIAQLRAQAPGLRILVGGRGVRREGSSALVPGANAIACTAHAAVAVVHAWKQGSSTCS